ncbi:aldehyde oxidase and xanthine dehydrogenase molybdopterin binding [Gluconacetobacter diazotrophicus PA1 5]|uniref:Xanthine dehydrogenase family protein molybdopterin-binding subunit n=2 Tax=Gluconacetobacter diazotrophicus TaxID=33996 RepID=A0A7W4FDW4_GLUDI|nr:molybdopterin cofactor-binding domain-containing protein [Gluconacetobacter diazotrophicus]ACI49817.1 aldehyde oxidase and xanthine dehydrogenase molybdopterin binding [Gluconacetobacter diazotrophicus PA1 5]MBB2155857.1 xanthine dehydrogenase family protein molybdopterin-binding subunit [Gluconacetobacter diazotrophicus]TWB10334.1 isoquinoline 1-oxidoreductase beta subunit [Gluconacetobacter diazotrophicus]CAP55729.1 putative isoquinoline 1-oxidoreductase subunit beta [Gluconacetobacter dia
MGRTMLSRRQALAGTGGLLLAAMLPRGAARAATRIVEDQTGPFAPNAFVRIAPDGAITLILPNVEMGQGIYTGEAMLIAEELDIGLEQIQIEAAPPDDAYVTRELGTQATGGSTSTIATWKSLREAGAVARTLLVQAAAAQWSVDPASCTTGGGMVRHEATGRSLAYGELATAAAALPVPAAPVTLRDPSSFRLVGRSQHRLDAPAKVAGTATFGIDVQVPGMRIGTVAACPVMGGVLAHVDDSAARQVPGVRDVLTIGNAVCVVGNHFWAARKGLDALVITWDEGVNAAVSTDTIYRQLHEALDGPAITAHAKGDARAAIAGATTRVEAVYQQPLLAHAPMEPINCTVQVTPERCDIWVGSQVPMRARDAAADITGLGKDRVHVHNQYIGGGFGRRLEHEYVIQAVQFARQVAYPLKIVWTREEDLTLDRFRPAYVDRLVGGLDRKGNLVGLSHRIVGPAVVARWAPEALLPNGVDDDLLAATVETPYAIPAMFLDYARREAPGVVTAWWRGVGGTRGVFVVESFIDELAARAGKDAVAFRRQMTGGNPRARAVLDLAAEKASWGEPLPKHVGRGIALQYVFGSYLATVMEVDMSDMDTVRVLRAVVAVDCGRMVNPDQVVSQIEGGLIFGISAALFNEVTLRDGRVQETNFHSYRVLRMNESPMIEVHLVNSTEDPGGIGETGTAAAAAALANAMAAATGRRYRRLPLTGPQA